LIFVIYVSLCFINLRTYTGLLPIVGSLFSTVAPYPAFTAIICKLSIISLSVHAILFASNPSPLIYVSRNTLDCLWLKEEIISGIFLISSPLNHFKIILELLELSLSLATLLPSPFFFVSENSKLKYLRSFTISLYFSLFFILDWYMLSLLKLPSFSSVPSVNIHVINLICSSLIL